tara:strand:- start:533 stop:745 length:213 start_codon:yes stop_codon:yes gene_type:complete
MAKRYFVNVTMEIFVPEQGLGEKSTKNEDRDAEWFADTIASKTREHINDEFRFAERDYHLNEVQVNYLED